MYRIDVKMSNFATLNNGNDGRLSSRSDDTLP